MSEIERLREILSDAQNPAVNTKTSGMERLVKTLSGLTLHNPTSQSRLNKEPASQSELRKGLKIQSEGSTKPPTSQAESHQEPMNLVELQQILLLTLQLFENDVNHPHGPVGTKELFSMS